MTESTDDLRAKVAALEAENAALRAADDDGQPTARRPRRSRAVAAVVLIVLGVLLAPVAVLTGWASWTLSDTERFVATYAPLADDPEVKAYVVDQVMVAIEERADFDQVAKDLVDGLISLGTRPRTTAALQSVQGSIADGLRSQVREGVTRLVESDQFDNIWRESLQVGHTQLVATLSNDPAAIAQISADGSLGIPLGPIVAEVKADLVQRGVTVAQRIPEVDRTIPLFKSDSLPLAQVLYGVTIALGTWLPWLVLVLLAGGVAVANRRHRTLVWASVGFALAMGVLAIAFAVGRIALVAVVPASVLPGQVATLFYDAVTSSMYSTAISGTVLGVAVALIAWLAGPFRAPVQLRAFYLSGVARLRAAAEERGLSTGRFGSWLHRRRSLVFALIAVVAAIVVVVSRPVTAGLVGWTAFWSVLAIIVLTIVERPDSELQGAQPAAAELPANKPAG